MKEHKNKIIAGVIAVIVLALVIKGVVLMKRMNPAVVYLSTGEVYVGELSRFPKMKLTNGYILANVQDANDPTKSTFQLSPINEALWAPESLYLNRKNVVFYGKLLPESAIAKKLAEQAAQ